MELEFRMCETIGFEALVPILSLFPPEMDLGIG